MDYTKSNHLYQRACKTISGGLHSNGRFRKPHPIYFQKAEGPYAYDVDGNRFIDLIMGNGTLLLGHNNPEFNKRMADYITQNGGVVTGFDTPLSISVAERFVALTKHERVRFSNTGTEAITHCLHIIRAYTGRNRIALMEGAYDGWNDAVYVNSFAPLDAVGPEEAPHNVPGSGGLDPQAVANAVILPFNNIPASEALIRAHKDELGAIILEPVMIDIGFVEATPEYIRFLRNICDELHILLVFDELLTGFRLTLGGAQEYYQTKCDLSIFGKAFANGYILAAVAGKKDVLDICAPGGQTNFIGTFNGHQVSLCAAAATFDMIEDGKVTQAILANTDYLLAGFRELANKIGVAAQIKGRGGHFQVYFTDAPPTNYRTAAASNAAQYATYVNTLQENGVWCSQNALSHHVLSIAHDQKVLDDVLAAMEKGLEAVAAMA